MAIIKKWVFCTFTVDRLHKWDEAKERKDLGVEFLSNLHRHLFHIKVKISVMHDNRDIEFIALKRRLLAEAATQWGEVVGSCEMMAEDVISWLKTLYPYRNYIVEVSEDGENGAIIEDLKC